MKEEGIPNAVQPTTNELPVKKKSKWWIWLIVIVVVLMAGGLIYSLLTNNDLIANSCEVDSDCVFVSGTGYLESENGEILDSFMESCINKNLRDSETYKDMEVKSYVPCGCSEDEILGQRYCVEDFSKLTFEVCISSDLEGREKIECLQEAASINKDERACAELSNEMVQDEYGTSSLRDNCYSNLAIVFANGGEIEKAMETCDKIEDVDGIQGMNACKETIQNY